MGQEQEDWMSEIMTKTASSPSVARKKYHSPWVSSRFRCFGLGSLPIHHPRNNAPRNLSMPQSSRGYQ